MSAIAIFLFVLIIWLARRTTIENDGFRGTGKEARIENRI